MYERHIAWVKAHRQWVFLAAALVLVAANALVFNFLDHPHSCSASDLTISNLRWERNWDNRRTILAGWMDVTSACPKEAEYEIKATVIFRDGTTKSDAGSALVTVAANGTRKLGGSVGWPILAGHRQADVADVKMEVISVDKQVERR